MWIRKVSFLLNFKCCRQDGEVEGYGEGKDWYVRMPIEEYTDYQPKGTLFKWAGNVIYSSIDAIEFLANEECMKLFPGDSCLVLCEGSIMISEIVLEQYKNGRRTRVDTMTDIEVEE